MRALSCLKNWTSGAGFIILVAMNTEFSSRLQRIETILAAALPNKIDENWRSLSFSALDANVTEQHILELLRPCSRLVALGGKRWRPLLLVLAAELASQAKSAPSANVENAYALTPLVEFAHTASLIHDDIEDCADMRRGQPAAHIAFGTDVAINAASWLYFEAPTCIEKLPLSVEAKHSFQNLYLLELRRLHLGQAMDILWHRNPSMLPTQEEYIAMVRNKTGTLARLAVEIGILAGGGTEDEAARAGQIAEDIGVGFQVLDDVINLTTGNPGKKRGDDIVEGKKSLPVLIHLENHPKDAKKLGPLFEKARAEGIRSAAVEEAISLLSDSGAIEAAKLCGGELISKKGTELAAFYGKNDFAASKLILELFYTLKAKVA